MRAFLDSLINPILVREMRGTLRGRKAFMSLTIFVLIATGVFFVAYLSLRFSVVPESDVVDLGRIGRKVFEAVSVLLTILILFFTPAFSANVIAIEREKKTLAFLEMTLLSPMEIVRGKLLASLLYILLLLVTTLPVLSMVFILGGVSPQDVVFLYLFLILEALLVASIGVGQSAANERTGTATLQTYLAAWFILMWLAPLSELNRSSGLFTGLEFVWFGWSLHALWALGLFVLLAVALFLELAAARLRNPEYEESFGERIAVGMAFLAALLFVAGVCTGTGKPYATSAVAPLVVCQLFLTLAMGTLVVMQRLTMTERRLPTPKLLELMFLPRHILSNKLLSFPGFALTLAMASALLQGAVYLLDLRVHLPFWDEWAIFNLVLYAFAFGFSLVVTLGSYVFGRFFPDLPRILKALAFIVFCLAIFSAEFLHHSVFSKTASPDGLPIPAAVIVYLCPFKALSSVDVPGARTQAVHSFLGEGWDHLADFPFREVPGWFGFVAVWLVIGLVSLRTIVWLRRFDRPEVSGGG